MKKLGQFFHRIVNNRINKTFNTIILFISVFPFTSCIQETNIDKSAKTDSPIHLIKDIETINSDSTINVVIEISTGSDEKWEVNKENGKLEPDSINGKPRKIRYIPYPFNYGMIPQTLLPKELGGDGDPLDVIVLGKPIERGQVIRCHLIGVLKLLDNGEKDDKLIAVIKDSEFGELRTLKSLDDTYQGISDIIEIWFVNYKGKEVIQSKGFSDMKNAKNILDKSISSYKKHNN